MTKQLHHLLTRITLLPPTDQRWIWKQLSSKQRISLKKYNGITQLREALGGLPLESPHLKRDSEIPASLPAFCTTLAMKEPLYTAIVIEQGKYPWQTLFLTQFDSQGEIRRLLHEEVLTMKRLVKQAIFKEWESSLTLDFEHLLEDTYG
jgi:hypothetical protein